MTSGPQDDMSRLTEEVARRRRTRGDDEITIALAVLKMKGKAHELDQIELGPSPELVDFYAETTVCALLDLGWKPPVKSEVET